MRKKDAKESTGAGTGRTKLPCNSIGVAVMDFSEEEMDLIETRAQGFGLDLVAFLSNLKKAQVLVVEKNPKKELLSLVASALKEYE